jgi:excisionase family DNA binding protein
MHQVAQDRRLFCRVRHLFCQSLVLGNDEACCGRLPNLMLDLKTVRPTGEPLGLPKLENVTAAAYDITTMSEPKPEVIALYQTYLAVTEGNVAAAASLAVADALLDQKPSPRGTALTVKQVAERLGVTAWTVYRLCNEGTLQSRRLATKTKGRGVLRISEDALVRFLSEVESERRAPARPFRHLGRKAS